MMGTKLLIFWSLFGLLAIGQAEDIRANDYEMKIEDGILKWVKKLGEIDELDLSNHGITEIKDGAFKNVTVKNLNLESNKIVRLESAAFSGLGTNLEKLNLGSNQIRLTNSSFVGLENLKLLNFSNNPIEHLTSGEFSGVPHTAQILLKGNKLHALNTGIFDKLTSNAVNKDDNYSDGDIDEDDYDDDYNHDDVDDDLDDDFPDRLSGLDYGERVIICIEDSVLEKVGIWKNMEPLPNNCVEIFMNRGMRYLKLRNYGIRSVAKGWYQLPRIPVDIINLSHNNLTELTPELLNDLPNNVKIVDLSRNLIKEIKKKDFDNVYLEVIEFEANVIENVEDGSFESSHLSKLNFARNKIADIAFTASLPDTLRLLDLHRNQIIHIQDEVFLRSRNLVQLNLAQNGITKIQSGAFEGLESLQTLILARNKISQIETDAFLGLKKLLRVSLTDNLIWFCGVGAFNGLEKLTDLRLNKNKFTNITKNNFAGLPATLETLDLDHNEITDIENGCFVNVPKNTLRLSNNKLSRILPSQFDIDNLKLLILKNNSINEMSPDAFQGLPKVEYLSLAGNQISDIPPGTARYLKALITFDISRNPFTKLKNGALYGIPKAGYNKVLIAQNQLEYIEGGIFEKA